MAALDSKPAGAPGEDSSSGMVKEKPQLGLSLSLCLDSSNQSMASVPPTPTAAMELLSVVPEDKRKSLEERMTKSGKSVVVETVVGFGNDGSKDGFHPSSAPSYTPGGPASPEPSNPTRVTRILCEKSREAAESSAAASDAAAAAAGPKDKSPTVDVKNDATVDVKKDAMEVDGGAGLQRLHPEESKLNGHFSAEELDSSDDDGESSRSSGDSRSQPALQPPAHLESQASRDEDGMRRSASTGGEQKRDRRESRRGGSNRKRKLFGGKGAAAAAGARENSRDGMSKRTKSYDLPSPDNKGEKSARPITHFFAPSASTSEAAHSRPLARAPPADASPPAPGPGEAADRASPPLAGELAGKAYDEVKEREKEVRRKEASLEARAKALRDKEAELQRRHSSLEQLEDEARDRALSQARADVADAAALRKQHDQKAREVMKDLLIRAAREERAMQSGKLASDTMRVGRVSYYRSGMSFQEVWEEGSAAGELRQRQEQLTKDKETLERDKKAFQKRCKGAGGASSGGQMAPPPVPTDEQAEQEEIYRLRAQKLKDRERQVGEEKEKLEREKHSLIRELKRFQDQQRSKYNDFPLLNNRYLLLHLLGKGGFSEVYRAFDLVELCDVACKIHELNQQWKEDKRANYMKHATREYEIQKKLTHQRIVRLKDVFEMTSEAFCTVLEHCDGGDLEQVLKEKKMIGEREARSIIMQVFAGLKYLNEQRQKVIHFDLKPGNILFHNGEVKISDFGLSKVMEEEAASSSLAEIELTSQGAGTYWYLPPECFEVGSTPPKISSKVDVWSAGVIFYQMLYGCKPFGHGMSQDHMLRDQTITKSTHVTFPEGKDVPKVSERAKEFVRRCLSYYQHQRPSVITVFQDPYLRQTGRQASTTPGTAGSSQASS